MNRLARSQKNHPASQISSSALAILLALSLLLADKDSSAIAQEKSNNQDAATKPMVAKADLTGIVQDEEGKPLEGVTVDVWHWVPGNETKTDARGRFTLKGFEPEEKVEVLFSKEGFSPRHFPIQPVVDEDWVIVLGNKTYFEGKIIGTDGKPVPDATIRATFGPVRLDGGIADEVPAEGKSRKDGTYRLYVAPGTYDFKVTAGARGVFRETSLVIAENQAKSLDVPLKKGVRFEANVIDSITSKPVEGFILWQWRGAKLFRPSSKEGKIIFEGLLPGEIEFNCGGGNGIDLPHGGGKYYDHGSFGRWWSAEAKHEAQRFYIDDIQTRWQLNCGSLHFDMTPDMPPITIVVEQGVTVTGRVTDPKGNPVENATVAPAKTGSGNSLTGDTRYSVKTAKDGAYKVVLPASNEATYNLMVHDGEYQLWRNWANGVSETMQTEPGKKIENYDLKLTEPATIRGRVTINGQPAANVTITTQAQDKRENRYYDPTTKSKEDGTFELKFIRPGKHDIYLLNENNAHIPIEVKAGETLEDIDLTSRK